MARSIARNPHCDSILCLATAVLVLVGIVMVFSASAVYAMETYHDSWYFLKRHVIWVAIGAVVLVVFRKLDYHKLQGLTYPAVFLSFLLLLAVLGVERHPGATFAPDGGHQRDLVGHHRRRADRGGPDGVGLGQDIRFYCGGAGLDQYIRRLHRDPAHAADVPAEAVAGAR